MRAGCFAPNPPNKLDCDALAPGRRLKAVVLRRGRLTRKEAGATRTTHRYGGTRPAPGVWQVPPGQKSSSDKLGGGKRRRRGCFWRRGTPTKRETGVSLGGSYLLLLSPSRGCYEVYDPVPALSFQLSPAAPVARRLSGAMLLRRQRPTSSCSPPAICSKPRRVTMMAGSKQQKGNGNLKD